MLQRVYAAFAWGMLFLGAVHMAATLRFFDSLTQSALWFMGAGIAIILAGTINLLNRRYGAAAPGLRWVCIGANVLMTAFGLTTGLVGRASLAELVIVVGLVGGAGTLSAIPASLLPSRAAA